MKIETRTDFDNTSCDLFEGTMKARDQKNYEALLQKPLGEIIAEKRRKLGRKVRVLDIGCGMGIFLEEIARLPDVEEAWGVDLHAHRRRRRENFRVADIERGFRAEALNGPFDLVVSVWVFSYIRNKLQALLNIPPLLSKDGEAHIHLPSYLVRTNDLPHIDDLAMTDPEEKRVKELLDSLQSSANAISFDCRFSFGPHDDCLENKSTFSLRPEAADCILPEYRGSFQPVGQDAYCYADYRLGSEEQIGSYPICREKMIRRSTPHNGKERI